MKAEVIRPQLLEDLARQGCADAAVCADCASQALAAADILSSYGEVLKYALSLYDARMWGRRKSNQMVQIERERREKKFSQPTSCLSTAKKKPGPGEIRVGKLILRKRPGRER